MISIIVPIYNVEQYLKQCIESIIHQTCRELEIILVDDGSTDKSGLICDSYARDDERIIVIHKTNGGLVSARKAGIQAAHGEYIAYVDGDDWIENTMYERLLRCLLNYKADIAMCGRYEDTGNAARKVFHGIAEGRYDKKELSEHVYPTMIVGGEFFEWGLFPGVWDKLFKRECVEPFQMAVDERLTMGEDAACTYPCMLNAGSIYVLHECLYHYRQTLSSMVKQTENRETARMRFRVLYESVYRSLDKFSGIFDLRSQWKEYVLFLMMARADLLYDGIEKLDYLFPFPDVKKGCKVVLYGIGTYGQRMYQYLKRTGFCNIVALADRNYAALQKQGLPVVALDEIGQYPYDAIVITNSFAKARNEIYRELTQKYPAEKVHLIDEELVKNKETWEAFGFGNHSENKQ